MNDKSLVDVLLVRLVREEEKNKVLEMLIKDAKIPETEAKGFVENTPCMISSGMQIQSARDLQNKMYPYIDILPKSYSGSTQTDKQSQPEETEQRTMEQTEKSDADDFSHSFNNEIDEDAISDDEEDIEEEVIGDAADAEGDTIEDEVLTDEDLIITSASEEVLLIERCHVCGRTPTDVQKLAPCRTCGERTCADCFDRVLHVCQKCASEGKVIDRPLKDTPEYMKEKAEAEDAEYSDEEEESIIPETDRAQTEKKDNKRTLFLAVILCFAVLAYVLVSDPFNLNLLDSLSGNSEITVPQPIPPADMPAASDSPAVTPADSTNDTTDISEQVLVDSTALPDSLPVEDIAVLDTTSLELTNPGAMIALNSIQPSRDFGIPETTADPILLETSPINDAVVPIDSLQALLYPITFIAGTIPLQIDNLSCVFMQDSTFVLLMAILHPETLDDRVKLISRTAATFDSTCVDQLVLYYRESDYHPISLMSFMSDSFNVISQNVSPAFIQHCQTYRPEIWDTINNQLSDWMTND